MRVYIYIYGIGAPYKWLSMQMGAQDAFPKYVINKIYDVILAQDLRNCNASDMCNWIRRLVVCIELNNDLTSLESDSYMPCAGIIQRTVLFLHQTDFDRSTFQSFSGFFPSYQHFPWATCLLQRGPSQVCILMSCKQVRTSINYKTHVLVKHDLYNEIDNYIILYIYIHICNLYFIFAPTSGSQECVRVSQMWILVLLHPCKKKMILKDPLSISVVPLQ